MSWPRSLGRLRSSWTKLSGMAELKSAVKEFAEEAFWNRYRSQSGLAVQYKRPVIIFTGNPGTGKTMMARVFADIIFMTGLVESQRCIEVQRDDLVGAHIGSTALKTKAVVQQARGATMFVDEAYRLAQESQGDFGSEALETIMGVIEGGPVTTSDRPAIIFAGYPAQMERFIAINPGLKRRTTHRFNFPDYSGDEIVRIFKNMCHRAEISVGPLDTELIAEQVQNYADISTENAGFAGRMLASCKASVNARLTAAVMAGESVSSVDTVTITMADVLAALESLLSMTVE